MLTIAESLFAELPPDSVLDGVSTRQTRYQDRPGNTDCQFALLPGNKLKFQSVPHKFDATLVEVELHPAEAGNQ